MKKFLIASVLVSVTMLGCNTPREEATRQTYTSPAEENRMENQGDMAAERRVQGRTDLPSQDRAVDPDRVSEDDSESIRKAYRNNLFEIELARLAQDRTDDQRVQELAAAIQQDHEEANQRLRAISSNLEVELSNELSDEKRDVREELAQLNGDEFDREYVETQMELHEEAVEFYEERRVETDDPQLADYFQQTLPSLRNHLQETREVAAR